MENLRQFRSFAAAKIQVHETSFEAKGYGRLSVGVAALVMLFVFCPMSITAVAAPYWALSSEMQGNSISATATLWEVSMSIEIQGASSESQVGMCSDEMQGFDECGKIEAVRFFVVSALLLSLASSSCLILAFLPFSMTCLSTAASRRKTTIAGVSLAAVVLLWTFLSVCIAASINVGDGYELSGAGFVFLVLEMFFVVFAIVLAMWELMPHRACPTVADSSGRKIDAAHPTIAQGSPPTLLSGGKLQEKEMQKDNVAKNVNGVSIPLENNAGETRVEHELGDAQSDSNTRDAGAVEDSQRQSEEVESEAQPSGMMGQTPLQTIFEGVAAQDDTYVENHEATTQLPVLQSPRREKPCACVCLGMQ